MPLTAVRPHKRFNGIFMLSRSRKEYITTLSLAPGTKVYGEQLVSNEIQSPSTNTKKRKKVVESKDDQKKEKEFRIWNPYKSKIGAALSIGLDNFPIAPGIELLYLGAASGTTVSHCSDIIGKKGTIYAVEYSSTSARSLLNLCIKRDNILPIKGDARIPSSYSITTGAVDCVFIDVSQKDQTAILEKNCKMFLKDGGSFMMSIKASSIDSSKNPAVVFEEEIRKLEDAGLVPSEIIRLEPYEKNHCFIRGQYKRKYK
eukprot:GAHX01000074.1.p1 GENE.GAHX01000074.1~~GAHX01000074.1.p1  ORF type:complete len:277 (+),score=51.09 GAHX01000074.1:59-832(+)